MTKEVFEAATVRLVVQCPYVAFKTSNVTAFHYEAVVCLLVLFPEYLTHRS